MNLEEDKNNLKEQILALSSIYTKKRLQAKFIKGETYIPASGSVLEEEEVANVIESVLSGWVTEGDYSKRFSRGLREYLNSRFCTLCNSGSSANLLAITATTQKEFGNRAVKEGDEFITAAVGFPTTVSGLIQNRIVPVFVDINPVSLTPDVELIEQAVIEGKTKGIIIAHALGSPYDIDSIRDICDEYGLWLIEDVCFVAGTEIVTSKGNIPIEKIVVGDLVMTRDGYKKVTASGMTGKRRVISRFGLTATPNHPIITKDGVKPLDALSASDIIYAWKKNTSTITEQSLQDTQIPQEGIYGFIFGRVVAKIESLSILKSGKTIMEKLNRAIMSIIETETLSITPLRTWNFYPVNSTPDTTGIPVNLKEIWHTKILKSQESLRKNGIKVQKERYFIDKLQMTLGKINQLIQQFVRFAGKSTEPIFHPDQKTVQQHARIEVEVYNLSVEDSHEFFANGILVHNCDAVGSRYNGKLVGTQGSMATMSFFPAHHITMGQGGAVLTNDGLSKKVLDSLHAWGRGCWCLPGKDNTCGKRFEYCIGKDIEYDHKYVFDRLGYNMQITDLQSAIGLAQLDKIKRYEERRKHNWKRLKEVFSEYKKYFILPHPIKGADPSWFGFHVTIKGTSFTRRQITEYLESKKIGTRLLFGGNLLQQPAFQHVPHKVFGTLENSDLITRNTFWLGVHPGIDEDRMDWIISTVRDFMKDYK